MLLVPAFMALAAPAPASAAGYHHCGPPDFGGAFHPLNHLGIKKASCGYARKTARAWLKRGSCQAATNGPGPRRRKHCRVGSWRCVATPPDSHFREHVKCKKRGGRRLRFYWTPG